MKSLLEKPKPGEFKAVCRVAHPVPLAEVLALPREEQPDTAHSHWSRKHGCEVVEIRCSETFTDRALFEAHMRKEHEGGLYRWDNGSLSTEVRTVATYSPRLAVPVKMWKAPKLTAGGRPFDTSKHPVRECEGCGLIAEFDGTQAWELWWREHTALCAGRAAAS